jgi:hypothetical protein
MIGLVYQAVYRFFTVCVSSLNKGEKDQPAPPDVEIKHLEHMLLIAKDRQRQLAEYRARVAGDADGSRRDTCCTTQLPEAEEAAGSGAKKQEP